MGRDATAYCPRHVDPFPSACLPCLSFNLCCVDKGPRQVFHAQVHPYTSTGKGRGLRGAFLSTTQTGTGTGSGVGFGKQSTGDYNAIGVVAAVAASTACLNAVAVHTYDTVKAATEIKRVEGERRLSEERLRAEVDRYKYDLQLRYSQDFKSYQDAKEQANKERGGTGGPQKEEETH